MKLHAAAVASWCVLAAASTSAQTTLLVSSWTPPNHHVTKTIMGWCADVAGATEKRVQCELLPKPVAPPPKAADAVRDGLADVSFVIDGYIPNPPVLTALTGLPFPPAESTGEAASVAYQRVFSKHLAKFDEHRDVKVLAVWCGSPNNLSTARKSVESLADLKGLKIQAGSRDAVQFLQALGAVPVAKPVSESYEMLSTGIVDGVLAPLEGVKSWRLDKFIKYSRRTPFNFASLTFLVSNKSWAKISAADRTAIERVSGEALSAKFGRNFDAADAEAIAVLKANGVEPQPIPPAALEAMRSQTKSLEQAWIDAAKAKGLANAADVLAEFRQEIVKVAGQRK